MKRMKKSKKSLLSLLLLSFVFLVVHDFVMPAFGAEDSNTITLQEQQMEDISEDIHKNIHTIIAVAIFASLSFEESDRVLQPHYRVTINDSNNLFILERPPLL